MSSKDFLEQMREAGEKYSEELTFLTVARMKIQFGYSGFVTGERPANFFKPFEDPKDSERVSDEVTARLAKAGSKRKAVLAILFTIPEITNTNEKVTWDIEQVTFTSKNEDSEWQILFDTLAEGEFPIGEWFWGSYKNEVVGEYERDGETKKRYLSLPVDKYKDEATAKAASGSSSASANSQWSETARANYPDLSVLDELADEINEWLEKAKKGIPFNNDAENYPLPVPNTPPRSKAYVAEIYNIESADIDIMIPF
jgi:hypothetical protein